MPIFDGHNDTLLRLLRTDARASAFYERGDVGQLDLPRAIEGGMAGGIFAVFVPAPPGTPDLFAQAQTTDEGYIVPSFPAIDPAHAGQVTEDAIRVLGDLITRGQGRVGWARKGSDLEDFRAQGTFAVLLHLEGAEAIRPDLSNLEGYYRRGVRSIGLVWSRPNAFGMGMDFRFPGTPDTGDGLTPQGIDLIKACRKLGMLVDLAHLNYKGFWDAARVMQGPLVVSHTGIHALCPVSRNLMDDQVDAVGQSGGIIGIMFEPAEMRADGKADADTPIDTILRHIDYVVQKIGVDHVGLGSDFDGAQMPNGLKDASMLGRLVRALEQSGYHGEALEKVLWGNWVRVIKEALGR